MLTDIFCRFSSDAQTVLLTFIKNGQLIRKVSELNRTNFGLVSCALRSCNNSILFSMTVIIFKEIRRRLAPKSPKEGFCPKKIPETLELCHPGCPPPCPGHSNCDENYILPGFKPLIKYVEWHSNFEFVFMMCIVWINSWHHLVSEHVETLFGISSRSGATLCFHGDEELQTSYRSGWLQWKSEVRGILLVRRWFRGERVSIECVRVLGRCRYSTTIQQERNAFHELTMKQITRITFRQRCCRFVD